MSVIRLVPMTGCSISRRRILARRSSLQPVRRCKSSLKQRRRSLRRGDEFVMAGLRPGHPSSPQDAFSKGMDARVKPAHDHGERVSASIRECLVLTKRRAAILPRFQQMEVCHAQARRFRKPPQLSASRVSGGSPIPQKPRSSVDVASSIAMSS